jgi:hypothetical protein
MHGIDKENLNINQILGTFLFSSVNTIKYAERSKWSYWRSLFERICGNTKEVSVKFYNFTGTESRKKHKIQPHERLQTVFSLLLQLLSNLQPWFRPGVIVNSEGCSKSTLVQRSEFNGSPTDRYSGRFVVAELSVLFLSLSTQILGVPQNRPLAFPHNSAFIWSYYFLVLQEVFNRKCVVKQLIGQTLCTNHHTMETDSPKRRSLIPYWCEEVWFWQ